MKIKKAFTGYSNAGITEAIENALQQAGEHRHSEVMETKSSYVGEDIGEHEKLYQVTLNTFVE